MMWTLLIRLSGPMQSWGTQSRFGNRDTGREPSKSGVVGLLCAALGRTREKPIADVTALKMGVRVDREGSVGRDYQTTGGGNWRGGSYGVIGSDGKLGGTVLSDRYYLADADFLVGLMAMTDEQVTLLRELDRALAAPVWQLALGRKAFVPGVPPRLPDAAPLGPGLREGKLLDVLRAYPWQDARGNALDPRVRFVLDAEPGSTADVRADVPLSFVSTARRFTTRSVHIDYYGQSDEGGAND
ncbi:MAG TPA: type I-E CRISPR-associated protein Cas5/CasD [Thermomicrobiales bacterium]|jgi:CRISPR system Cascade subunit CasD